MNAAAQPSANLYVALRAAFPSDVATTAVESWGSGAAPLHYSWYDLDAGSARIANLLLDQGMAPGNRVLVQVEKSAEALMLYLAVLRAGLVFVPLNPAYREAEMRYFVEDAQPAVVVCAPENFGWISKLAFQQGASHVYTLGTQRQGTLLDRAAHYGDAAAVVPRGAEDVAAILYTSGTTGRSKGAMLTHSNLLSNARVLQDYWGWVQGDVLLHALPIFHVHGLFVAIHGALLSGSKMLWMARFDPAQALLLLARSTVFMGVPTLYVRMLAEPGWGCAAVAGMRLFISGSAPLLTDTFTAWQQRSGHTILERYGMSETIMLTSNPYVADARYGGAQERRAGTVGFPLPGVGLRIVDDTGTAVVPGEVGQIQVQGPGVFAGYWQMPEKTASEFTADGWFRTGDVGRTDAQGYVCIVGRSKDLIISGGFNVYPAEIESCINALDGVAESAVVGVPHADFGEVGVAVVVPRAGAALDAGALLQTLRQQLAGFKVPKRCVVVDELPRNAMGKVQKNLLRTQYQDLD